MGTFTRQAGWWKDGTIYQIYPRSFQDGDADGVGDLAGIRSRLSHLVDLGVDAVWLSPIFASPMKDFGYDVADYRAIDPLFGTMEDFDALLAEAHDLGLKLLLDFVPNHTSDQHRWFEESRSSRDDPRRDWYIWRDPAADGGPPNNWISNFGGPAWHFDERTGQYYHHAFLASQPDLNWRNPEVRAAMFDVMRFWLDKGVDGFRVDVIWHLVKDAQFRDNPPNPSYRPGQPEIERNLQVHSADQPEIHELVTQMRGVVGEYDHRLLIGEIYLPLERLVAYYGEGAESGVHLPFNFLLLQCPWRPRRIAALVREYEEALPAHGWPNWVLSNHDRPRIGARVGERQARIAAMLLLTLRGTPTIYYGDEIGLCDVEIPPDRVQDPWALQEPDASFNRDRARTPMQWSTEPNAGFSPGEPWLPLSRDWRERNVASLCREPGSMLDLHRRLLALRRRERVLREGDYRELAVDDRVFAFERRSGEERVAVILNFTGEEADLPALPDEFSKGERVFSSAPAEGSGGKVPDRLAPDEGIVVKPVGGPS
ncbi:alpha-amylase family glycosyl hydrolase [Erythrobacter sp. HL-111]|uniref:alpha-amylase family glycosyl hydrolase n=1 Tax=Erythrobacter sp. HL-111 TaxID=1798193 RepID=UPI0006DA678F|nr:alpha-amylase family glycosyl hydrolase [Erythrobacter sp. HL-111]KPP88620.1 MAG: alpha-glucosidase MalZ [Erythrobacteraceae bacterium HL-111]SDS32113.1 alpha-glucosidase [Erythrobacter sp. HL-111]